MNPLLSNGIRKSKFLTCPLLTKLKDQYVQTINHRRLGESTHGSTHVLLLWIRHFIVHQLLMDLIFSASTFLPKSILTINSIEDKFRSTILPPYLFFYLYITFIVSEVQSDRYWRGKAEPNIFSFMTLVRAKKSLFLNSNGIQKVRRQFGSK